MSRPNLARPRVFREQTAHASFSPAFPACSSWRRARPAGWTRGVLAAGLFTALAGAVGLAPARAATTPAAKTARLAMVNRSLAQLPLRFEQNLGQSNTAVRFLARNQSSVVFLTATGAVVKTEKGAVGMQFRGTAAAAGAPQGEHALSGRVNYLLGKGSYSVPSFGQVRYQNLYPGVDLVYYGRQGQLEYDLRVAPRAEPARIQMQFTGAVPVVAGDGTLQLKRGVFLRRPVAYQWIAGQRHAVEVRYTLASNHTVGFKLGAYDRTRAVVIDPVLAYATYLGGSAYNQVTGVALDASGSAYVTGYTASADFPMPAAGTTTPYQANKVPGANYDAFVVKLSADGSSLVYSTYLGGTQYDQAATIAIDGAGDAFVAGSTTSPDFPTTVGAFQTASKSNSVNGDGFLSELSPDGSSLLYSTYLSGSAGAAATSLAVYSPSTSVTNVFVAGYTASSDYPVTGGAPDTTFTGGTDGFVTVLNPVAGAAPIYSTLVGGASTNSNQATISASELTKINALAVDGTGNAYFAGTTSSKALPVANAMQSSFGGGTYDGFAGEIFRTGRGFNYLTYIGGNANDDANAITVDAAGNAFIAGDTSSVNLFGPNTPSLSGGSSLSNPPDAFFLELNSSGVYSFVGGYLGGSGVDVATGIAVDSGDNIYVVGRTSSTDLNVVGALQSKNGGAADAFLVKVGGAGQNTLYATYLGGGSNDWATGVAINANGNIAVAGVTNSLNFPVTKGALQAASLNSNTGFVASFVAAAQGSFSPSTVGFSSQASGVGSTPASVVFTNVGEKALTISGITTTGPFAQTNTCPATLQPQQTCTISIVFTPTSAQSVTGTLVVADNSPQQTETLPLQGNGGDFTLAVAPTQNTISAGTSASYLLQVAPAKGYTGVVTLSCAGAPPNSTCVASPTSLTMNGSTPSSATFTVTTTIRPSLVPPAPVIPPGPWTWLALLGLALGGLGILAAAVRSRRRRLGWAGIAVLVGWAAVAMACGGSTTNPGTTAGNYTLTFTGTAGSVKHDITTTLTVN